MTSTFPAREVGLATIGALVWHSLWAASVPVPIDWDPAYYLDVARNIVAGKGAVSGVIWQWSGPELALPQPADLHWMPLPSRVLVPFVAVAGTTGASVAAVIMAASWVPLAAMLTVRLGGDARAVRIAVVLAALGGGYVRFLSTPDSLGLYGMMAGLGWLTAADRRVFWTAVLAFLAALTRGDGFLLALSLGVVLWAGGQRRGALTVALAGPLAWLSWALRSAMVAGPAWWDARARTASALHIHDFLVGGSSVPDMADRLQAALAGSWSGLMAGMLVGVGVLPLVAGVGVAICWRHRLVAGLVSYACVMLTVPCLLAPGVAASGSAFRSGAALFPAACGLAALGACWLSELGHRKRGYPVWFIPGLLVVGAAVGGTGLGLGTVRARPGPPVHCPEGPAPAVVFSGRPLLVRSTCGPMAVALFRSDSPEAVAHRARLHGVFVAWVPEAESDPFLPSRDDAARLLPGWREWADGVWLHPDALSPTAGPSGW